MSEAQPASDRAGIASTVLAGLPAERVGSEIGPYKLRQQIGEGEFGLVYMAEQEKVALKIIKPGMDSAEVIARFESERQALALMDHPNVAKVLDAGATRSGHDRQRRECDRGSGKLRVDRVKRHYNTPML
jgi:serine/threonine protein kinase